jgi:hypothetical protein
LQDSTFRWAPAFAVAAPAFAKALRRRQVAQAGTREQLLKRMQIGCLLCFFAILFKVSVRDEEQTF